MGGGSFISQVGKPTKQTSYWLQLVDHCFQRRQVASLVLVDDLLHRSVIVRRIRCLQLREQRACLPPFRGSFLRLPSCCSFETDKRSESSSPSAALGPSLTVAAPKIRAPDARENIAKAILNKRRARVFMLTSAVPYMPG